MRFFFELFTDESCFFTGGLPTETHYIIKKHIVADISKNYLFEAWAEKDKELDLFYNQGQIKQKKIATPVSSHTWLLQNIGRAKILPFSPDFLYF